MPTLPPAYAGLEGLLDLAQEGGVDIRATLLRVLTDLYVQKRTQTADDERHYTELALRLIDEVDEPTRALVAARLAAYPLSPRPVVLRLARDVPDIAAPVLRHSPCLTPADLELIASERGEAHAALIARRGREHDATDEGNAAPTGSDTRSPVEELSELFFAAKGPERQLILTNLDYMAPAPSELAGAPQSVEIARRLEAAALQHNSDAFARELERALAISNRQAHRIVGDEQGEAIVVAAKALNVPRDALQRILLFVNPLVGQSVERVYDLSSLYDDITPEAARHLVSIWRQTDPPGSRAVRTSAAERRSAADARPEPAEKARQPAPQSAFEDARPADRAFSACLKQQPVPDVTVEERLTREIRFDQDAWIVEVEDRAGRHFLDRLV